MKIARRWRAAARQDRFHAFTLGALLLALAIGCTSGLDGGPIVISTSSSSPNLRSGIDLGFSLGGSTEGAEGEGGLDLDYAIAGGLVPDVDMVSSVPGYEDGNLPVIFVAFVTSANIDDPNGDGDPAASLDPEVQNDPNGGRDVVIAAIPGLDLSTVDNPASFKIGLDSRVFSQAVAPFMRHPRCTTCHLMRLETDVDGDNMPDFGIKNHLGGDPPVDNSNCQTCHMAIGEDWLAPPIADGNPEAFRLIDQTDEFLFELANTVPEGDLLEHFEGDARVDWALGVPFGSPARPGMLPTNDGMNGIADDDHDGVEEKEDTDGVARSVPGGKEAALDRVRAWLATKDDYGLEQPLLNNDERGVADVALASRSASAAASAGAMESFAPALTYVPNGDYLPGSGDPVGTLHVAFVSMATDLVDGIIDNNSEADVFLSRIDVRVNEDSVGNADAGNLNLTHVGTELVSQSVAGMSTGNDASGFADGQAWGGVSIGGMEGQTVAFASTATDLVGTMPTDFNDTNGPDAPDVFVRRTDLMQTIVGSRGPASETTGGNGASMGPDLSVGGRALAFESSATDLDFNAAMDANGVQDIYVAQLPHADMQLEVQDLRRVSLDADGQEGSGGASRAPTVFVFDEGASDIELRVAFESDKDDLVLNQDPASNTNVFLRDDRRNTTVLLSQILGPDGEPVIGAATQRMTLDPAPADSRAPQISADGRSVVFESLAENIDNNRPDDENYEWDVFVADLSQFAEQGFIYPFRASVTAGGGDGDGASIGARVGSFTGDSPFPEGFATFLTEADNLGASGDLPLVSLFLTETGSLGARFDPSVEKAGPAPIVVNFSDESSGSPTAWAWDFGVPGTNTDTSIDQNPVFEFTDAGVYTVTLEVTSDLGTASTTRVVRIVDVISEPGILPTIVPDQNFENAMVTSDNRVVGIRPFSVQFRAQVDPDDCPETYSWDVDGDGVEDYTTEQIEVDYTDARLGELQNISLVVTNPAGASEPQMTTVGIFNPVTAAFTPDDTDIVVPVGVPFVQSFDSSATTGDVYDGSEPGVIAFQWSFGDDATPSESTEANPQNVQFPASSEPYAVMLTVTGNGLDESEAEATIQVYEQVTAVASVLPGGLTVGVADSDTFAFISDGSSMGPGVTYEWFQGNPGAGGVSLGPGMQLETTLSLPGGGSSAVEVFLMVNGSVGTSGMTNESLSLPVTVDVFPPVVASFTSDPSRQDLMMNGLIPNDSVVFTSQVMSPGATVEWYDDPNWNGMTDPPGGGVLSSDTVFNPTYTGDGNHQVILRAQGPGNDSSFDFVEFGVGSFVDFTVTFDDPATGQEYTFTDTSSPPNMPQSLVWDFGDGSPDGSGVTDTHTYSVPGTKDVKLTYITAGGTPGMLVKEVPVFNPTIASFTFPTLIPDAPGTVEFTSTSTGDGLASAGGNLVLTWDFGDPNTANDTATGQVVEYEFPISGIYEVVLTVNGEGGEDTEPAMIFVPEAVEAGLMATSATMVTHGTGVTFESTSTGTITSYEWRTLLDGMVIDSEGDTATSAADVDAYTFTTSLSGMYDVELTVTGPNGSDTTQFPSQVIVGPGFGAVFANIEANCLSCHTPAGMSGGLVFEQGEEEDAYLRLVGIPANVSGPCMGFDRVRAFDLSESVLYQLVLNPPGSSTCGTVQDQASMAAGDELTIQEWIEFGAQR